MYDKIHYKKKKNYKAEYHAGWLKLKYKEDPL